MESDNMNTGTGHRSAKAFAMRTGLLVVLLTAQQVAIASPMRATGYDYSKLELTQTIPLTKHASCLAYSPDGSMLACGGYKWLSLLDAQSGSVLHSLSGHTRAVVSVDFSPNGMTRAKLWTAPS